MTPRSLFAIILKIIGIYFIIEAITVFPQFITTIYSYGRNMGESSAKDILQIGFFILLAVFVYGLVLRYCLFKTDWVIDKLHLDRGFSEEKFEINIHRSTVLKIAVIVIGTMIIIDYLPFTCEQIFQYFQLSARDTDFKQNPASRGIVLDVAKLFIGFFLVTSSRLVVNFIERKRKGPAIKAAEATEE